MSLVLVAGIAFGMRTLAVGEIFVGDELLLRPADSSYQARRALYSFVNFPAVLTWDAYLAHPDGARVPMPPLHPWLLAGVARSIGSEVEIFERVAAFWSPILAALAVLPVFAIGRALGGAGCGLGAAALFSVLPASIERSEVGDVDHHALVALIVACLVGFTVEMARSGAGRRRIAWASLGLALARLALVMTWSGSLLYLAIGEASLLLAGVLTGRRALLAGQALGCLAAAAGAALWLLRVPPAQDALFSTTDLSWAQPVALLAASAVAGGLAALEGWRPARGSAPRLLRAIALAAVAALAILLVLPRAELERGSSFLARQDSWAPRNLEQMPLFPRPGSGPSWISVSTVALPRYGFLAFAIPIAALAPLARARVARLRAACLCLSVWSLPLAALALMQIRFGGDFAPVACVGFALAFAELRAPFARRLRPELASAAVVALAAALLWPALRISLAPRFSGALAFLRGVDPPATAGPFETAQRSLIRFARMAREATDETSGFLDAKARPEYGVLCKPSDGGVLVYQARRPTPASNFGPYLDAAKYEAALDFYLRPMSEADALAAARHLDVRYVVSFDHMWLEPKSLQYQLQLRDGSAPVGGSHVRHFRLITEGPQGFRPDLTSFPTGLPRRRITPYKLYEVVEGALLEARGEPGADVQAELELVTPLGRRIRFRAAGEVGPDGTASLRVPYPTQVQTRTQTRSIGPYRLSVGGARLTASVSEEDVRTGATVAAQRAP